VRGWRVNKWRWWIAFGVLAGLAMYAQQLAAFYLLALALVPLLARRGYQIKRVFVGGVSALVLYLPWLVNLPGQLDKVRSYYWLAAPSIAQPLLTTRSFLVVNLDFPAPAAMLGFLAALFIVLFLLLQVSFYLRRRIKADQNRLLFVLWLAGGPAALMWLVSQWQPVYLERALLPSALMLYLALAWLFTRSSIPRPISVVIAAIGLLLVGTGLYYQYSWATFPNSPFQAATQSIRARWQAGDVVVHQNKLTALPSIYYARDLTQRYLGDLPGSPQDTLARPTQEALRLLADDCVQAASEGASRVWWVTFTFAEEAYATAKRPEFQQAQDWLATHYQIESSEEFNDLRVALYIEPDVQDDACETEAA
jgi:hypothetical protein